MATFRQQMHIHLTQNGREAVGIVQFIGVRTTMDTKMVSKTMFPLTQSTGEKAILMQTVECGYHLATLSVDHLNPLCTGLEGSHHQPFTTIAIVDAANRKRIFIVGAEDRLDHFPVGNQFLIGQRIVMGVTVLTVE